MSPSFSTPAISMRKDSTDAAATASAIPRESCRARLQMLVAGSSRPWLPGISSQPKK
jgi:hypothetical protein